MPAEGKLHIVFDGPPGPTAGRFVECENDAGMSIRAGEWRERPDGFWELVIDFPARITADRAAFEEMHAAADTMGEDGAADSEILAAILSIATASLANGIAGEEAGK